jgi:hypothetical protein
MKPGTVHFQQWVSKNRLLLWWMIFLPLMAVILVISWEYLIIPTKDDGVAYSFLQEILNTMPLLVLSRIVLIAVGLVVILICLFFPVFRVGKEGVQWTREKEEELAQVTGEITGAEVEHLIEQEALRWSLVYKWLHFNERKEMEPPVLLRELVATVLEVFPEHRLSLTMLWGDEEYILLHPLLVRMVPQEETVQETFGVKMIFSKYMLLVLHIYSEDSIGFSTIDESFILILCEVFLQATMQKELSLSQLVAYFDLINNRLDS